MQAQKKISSKNQYEKNPRKITDEKLELLGDHLQRLGDLSGITYCRLHKAYVTGNQRSKLLDGAEIKITESFDTPTEQKTVALGYVINPKNGEKYNYREVEFTDVEFREALIVANSDGGEFDFVMMMEDYEKEEVESFGLMVPNFTKEYKFDKDEDDDDDDEIERGTDDDDLPKEKDNTKTAKQPEEEHGDVPLFMNISKITNLEFEKIKKKNGGLSNKEAFALVIDHYKNTVE